MPGSHLTPLPRIDACEWATSRRLAATIQAVFKYLLVLENGEPVDPAAFVVATPTWRVGNEFFTGQGQFSRILGIETEIADELLARGFNAVWTVEPI